DADARQRIHDRFGRKLGKFAPHIERASVRIFDVNGPRGGQDTACRVKVVLSGSASVVTEETASTAAAASDRAVDSVERAVRKAVERGDAPKKPRTARPAKQQTSTGASRAAAPPSTATRNVKKNTAGMTVALEDSATGQPSRKSTRGSVNRAKRDNKKRLRAVREARAPKRQAT